MKRLLVNPKETQPMYESLHFSQANRVGDTICVSGQVGVDDNLTPASAMAAQACLAFEGLKRTVAAADASLSDAVELTTFHVELRGELEQFTKAKDECIARNYPALGALGGVASFVSTVTIIPFMPDGWNASAGGFPAMQGNLAFVMKGVVLLAVPFYLLKQDLLRLSIGQPLSSADSGPIDLSVSHKTMQRTA